MGIALLLFLLTPELSHVHPHMFIESFLEFELEADECAGVWVDWGFDSYFSVSVFDPTYFCAVSYRNPPAGLRAQPDSGRPEGGAPVRFSLETNEDYPVHYNPYGAIDDTRTYTAWQPGLETAYPDEILVSF